MSGEVKQFEDFSLDRGAYVLRRGGQVVHLQRLPLELLFLLVERRGQLVTRQEILDRVWGKGVFVDVDNAINTAIRKIRRALDDDSEAPRFVVTVPAMGYRFIAALHETKPETSNARSAVRSGQSALVGRERELARLRGGLEETVSGHGSLFLISGAPGVGKTRLSSEMARLADEFTMTVLIGHCAEQDEAVPYLPFVEVLESCLDRATWPGTSARDAGRAGARAVANPSNA
jgi:DNA-binding winged helix-turn-helix (wHTH) protein